MVAMDGADAPVGSPLLLLLQSDNGDADNDEKKQLMVSTSSPSKQWPSASQVATLQQKEASDGITVNLISPTKPPSKDSWPSMSQLDTVNENKVDKQSLNKNDQIIFLIEVVKATIPKRRGKKGYTDAASSSSKRGMHCTASWIGPINPSGMKRREKLIHRTETLSIINSKKNDEDGVVADEVDCTEHIFIVGDSSLFLFKTTMKQLVNASVNTSTFTQTGKPGNADDVNDRFSSGGLRFDIFEKPLDMISSVLTGNIWEKEANAITREISSGSSYRLVGSVFLTPDEILSNCDEKRYEHSLMENWRKIQKHQYGRSSSSDSLMRNKTVQRVGGSLALRVRLASDFDVAFMKSLSENKTKNGMNSVLQRILIQNSGGATSSLKPAQLITELDENVLTAQASMKAIGNISPIARESLRYALSKNVEKRILVKPNPDPKRPKETTWFTEEGLHNECYKESVQWIQAGQAGSTSLGTVYLEVLECRGLPNTDAGGSIGNKTDAFCSLLYGDIMVQTDVIDDSCSPMWMPWSSRAFVFPMRHPSTVIYVGVTDYDLGPLEHKCIGRVAIHLGKYHPGTLYTLSFNLHESSNLTEVISLGTLTVRLRIEIPDEKKYLIKGWQEPGRSFVNCQQWKSHRVAKYCIDGPHDEEVFEMRLFRSHINEILTQKRYLLYAISDAMRSLIYWRGQVKVGKTWLPLHSAIVFYFSTHLIENWQLLPSFILFSCGWVMIANMLNKVSHPNPWHRGHSFTQYFNTLTHGHSKTRVQIHALQGLKEASMHEAKWKQRIIDEDADYASQLELDAKIKTIADDAVIRTKAKTNGALVDPIAALAGTTLLPYQQRLSGYCNRIRHIRNVLNWNESIISFFITCILLGAGFAALFVPWRFLFQWTSRLVVWVFLGPWMKIADQFLHEETQRQKLKVKTKRRDLFQHQQKMAKILKENALKIKPFRIKLFGRYITRLPEFNLTRHEDVPLPESYAEPYHSDEEIKTVQFVPSQDLSGPMIPTTGRDAVESKAHKQEEKGCLLGRYQMMVKDRQNSHFLKSESAQEDTEFDAGYELELISTKEENQVICLESESSSELEIENHTSTGMPKATTTPSSERDIVVSDEAIHLALGTVENQMQGEPKPPHKSNWVFSASVQLSLRRETVKQEGKLALSDGYNLALCADASQNFIEHSDDVSEEGVEIVPLDYANDGMSESDAPLKHGSGDHVSVFYHLKDDTNDKMKDTEESVANQGKHVSFNESMNGVD